MICPTGEAKYFCKGDSTQKCPTGKSPAANHSFVQLSRRGSARKIRSGSNLAVSRSDRAHWEFRGLRWRCCPLMDLQPADGTDWIKCRLLKNARVNTSLASREQRTATLVEPSGGTEFFHAGH